jgi:MscS family membrane protein
MDIKAQLIEFWQIVKDVWSNGIMGVDIGQLIIALGILLLFLIFRGLFANFVLNRLHSLSRRTRNAIDDKIIDAIAPPIRFVPVIIGLFFAFGYVSISDQVDEFGYQLTKSLIAFTMFWILFRCLEPIAHGSSKLERILTPMMVQWIFKAMRVVIIFLGAAVILEIWGIAIGPILAGFGLLGAAVALGAQDVFKNLIAGITVIAEKRFAPGEWIRVDGIVEGTVEEIGFRSTSIRRFDKAPVHVPNTKLADDALINFSRMTHRRIYWTLGVVYGTSVDQLKIIRDEIMTYIQENEAFDKEPSTFVRIDSFNASSIDIMIYCFTKTTNWGEWLDIKEQFAFTIKEIVEEKAQTSFAFPSTSIYIESMPNTLDNGDRPEAFIPPQKDDEAKA